MKEMIIEHNGRSIYGVLEIPKTSSKVPLIICSHGYNGSYEGFELLQNTLSKFGVATFAYDFCGGSVNAKSSMSTEKMTIETEVEDLLAVYAEMSKLEMIDHQNIILLGESQGGLVSALCAGRLQNAISRLILIFPALCIPDNWNSRFKTDDEIPEVEEFWGMKLGKNFFLGLRNLDVFTEISKYKNEVLLFHGLEDVIVPVAYSEKAAAGYNKAELITYENEGHGFTKATNEKVIDRIKEFLFS